MARIDRFLDAMIQRGAESVRLISGERASLMFGDKARPVTSAALQTKLLSIFLKEIVPAELAGEVEQPGEHRFVYDSPSGRMTICVEREPDAIQIDATRDAGSAPAPPKEPPAVTLPRPPEPAPPPEAEATAILSPGQAFEAPELPAADMELDSVPPGPETAAMDALFREMVEQGCSDLHLSSGAPPLFRKDGGMVPLSSQEVLDPARAKEMLYSITPPRRRAEFEERHDSDFSYEIPELGRFRCNLFMDRRGIGGVFRVIPRDILTVEDLGISQHILNLCQLSKGLVVVTGPTGSGKSTTLAALIDYINENRNAHIITIEDPIEFVHENKKCLINQREIQNHTDSFKAALRAALREDPDIVLVGEMRDLETVEIAIETAETGHLVFGTLHTNTAASTVDRMIDQFPSDRQGQVRTMLASSLKGVVAQTLCKKPGGGRVAALEVLIVNAAVSNLVREGKTFQIGSIMQTGKKLGMVTLGDALASLVEEGLCEALEAYGKSVDKAEFTRMLNGRGIQFEPPGGDNDGPAD
jgi:twitching motility protein PilT